MSSGYEILRVDDSPPPVRVAPSENGDYLRSELKKVIAQRDELSRQVKAMSEADGPAAYWKERATDTAQRLTQSDNRVQGLQRQLTERDTMLTDVRERLQDLTRKVRETQSAMNHLQVQVVTLSDERDKLAALLVPQDVLKQQLWELWSPL